MATGKTFFTIGDAATMVGVVPATLRNWERDGLIKPERQKGNYRIYSLENIERLKLIKHLLQVKGFNIVGVKEHLGVGVKPGEGRAIQPERQGTRVSVGLKLKHLRDKQGLTLEEVMRKTKVSVSYLSRIESGQVNASLTTLQKLATFYDKTLLYFFEGQGMTEQKLVRQGQGKIMETDDQGLSIELLHAIKNPLVEPLLYRVAPGCGRKENIAHEGEEFLIVQQGALEIWLDETERYVVEAGDSFSFKSNQQHRWQNIGTEELVVLWINTPPTF